MSNIINELKENYSENLLFQYFSKEEFLNFLDIAEFSEFQKNQTIYKRDEAVDGLYLVIKGKVSLNKTSKLGRKVLAEVSAPTFLGEIDLNGELRLRNALCLEDTATLFISKKRYLDLLAANNLMAFKLAYNISQALTAKISIIYKLDAKAKEFSDFKEALFSEWNY